MVATLSRDGSASHLRELKVGDTWYQEVLHLVPDSDRIRCFIIDVTDRKRAEDVLQQKTAYLAALHETALGLIRRLDVNELIQSMVSRPGSSWARPTASCPWSHPARR